MLVEREQGHGPLLIASVVRLFDNVIMIIVK